MSSWPTHRCPRCGSEEVRGGAMDRPDGDEHRELFCTRCHLLEDRLRSEPGFGAWLARWSAPAAVYVELEAGVLADPADDTPRWALARELERRGDPRGDFIAAQLEVADLRRSADRGALAWAAPFERAQALLRRFGGMWRPPLPDFATEPIFARGFVESVRVPAAAFLDGAAALFAVAPIRQLRVDGAGACADRFFASPHLGRMIALDLFRCGLGDDGACALAASPHLGALVWLDLRGNRIGARGVDALVASARLPRLAYVQLDDNLVESPAERWAEDGGLPSAEADAAERRYGPRAWLRAASLHPYAWPPGPADLDRR